MVYYQQILDKSNGQAKHLLALPRVKLIMAIVYSVGRGKAQLCCHTRTDASLNIFRGREFNTLRSMQILARHYLNPSSHR